MINAQCERPKLFFELGKRGSRFFLNRYFYLFIFCLACAVSALGQEVYGAVLFVAIICICLVLSDDIVSIFLPFLLLCVFLTNCYDSAGTFIKFIWLIVPVVAAFLFHFIVYRGEFSMGSSIWGLFAVAVAVTMGGISWISGYEYFTVVSFYYMIFLGVGMIVLYLAVKSQFTRKRDYDLKERLILLFYIMGAFACFMVLLNVVPLIKLTEGIKLPVDFQPANNLSTFLMFAMPCPFFYAKKNRLHIAAPFLMVLCMFLSGSRAGALLGAIELLICLAVWAIWDRPRRFFYICVGLGFIGFLVIFKSTFIAILERAGLYPFIGEDEPRVKLIAFSFDKFLKNPIFGHGLGYQGIYRLYRPKTGAMGWYHMMIPQIIGSLGIVGIGAYLFQGINQLRIVFKEFKRSVRDGRAAVLTLTLSYVGILLMSQVNPGLFCPLPYYLMAVIIFATMDGEGGIEFIRSVRERMAARRRKDAEVAEKAHELSDISVEAGEVDEIKEESEIMTETDVNAKSDRVKVVAKRISRREYDDLQNRSSK